LKLKPPTNYDRHPVKVQGVTLESTHTAFYDQHTVPEPRVLISLPATEEELINVVSAISTLMHRADTLDEMTSYYNPVNIRTA